MSFRLEEDPSTSGAGHGIHRGSPLHLSGKWDSNPRCDFSFQLGRLAPSTTRRLPHFFLDNVNFYGN